MKHTILDLKKKVLVVEVPEEDTEYFSIASDEFEGQPIKFICKGSDLTEEIASGIVDDYFDKTNIRAYRDYTLYEKDEECFYYAIDSFKSAIKNNNFYWLENPLGQEPKPEDYFPTDKPINKFTKEDEKAFYSYYSPMMFWQQAEEKTFRNCLLLEIL